MLLFLCLAVVSGFSLVLDVGAKFLLLGSLPQVKSLGGAEWNKMMLMLIVIMLFLF